MTSTVSPLRTAKKGHFQKGNVDQKTAGQSEDQAPSPFPIYFRFSF